MGSTELHEPAQNLGRCDVYIEVVTQSLQDHLHVFIRGRTLDLLHSVDECL